VSDTPRTNAILTAILETHGHVGFLNCPPTWVAWARELERELNAANQRIEELEREIDRLNMRILSLEVAGQNVVYQATEMWKRGAIKEWLDLVRKEEDKP
jgi:hypothetical protein